MFQTVCSHKMWYVNFQPKVILSLKIKSRKKNKTNKNKQTNKKTGNTHSVFSSAQKSVSDPCGAEEPWASGIPKDVKEYTEILSDIKYFYL